MIFRGKRRDLNIPRVFLCVPYFPFLSPRVQVPFASFPAIGSKPGFIRRGEITTRLELFTFPIFLFFPLTVKLLSPLFALRWSQHRVPLEDMGITTCLEHFESYRILLFPQTLTVTHNASRRAASKRSTVYLINQFRTNGKEGRGNTLPAPGFPYKCLSVIPSATAPPLVGRRGQLRPSVHLMR